MHDVQWIYVCNTEQILCHFYFILLFNTVETCLSFCLWVVFTSSYNFRFHLVSTLSLMIYAFTFTNLNSDYIKKHWKFYYYMLIFNYYFILYIWCFAFMYFGKAHTCLMPAGAWRGTKNFFQNWRYRQVFCDHYQSFWEWIKSNEINLKKITCKFIGIKLNIWLIFSSSSFFVKVRRIEKKVISDMQYLGVILVI